MNYALQAEPKYLGIKKNYLPMRAVYKNPLEISRDLYMLRTYIPKAKDVFR